MATSITASAVQSNSKSLQRKKWVTNEELRIAYNYTSLVLSTRANHNKCNVKSLLLWNMAINSSIELLHTYYYSHSSKLVFSGLTQCII